MNRPIVVIVIHTLLPKVPMTIRMMMMAGTTMVRFASHDSTASSTLP